MKWQRWSMRHTGQESKWVDHGEEDDIWQKHSQGGQGGGERNCWKDGKQAEKFFFENTKTIKCTAIDRPSETGAVSETANEGVVSSWKDQRPKINKVNSQCPITFVSTRQIDYKLVSQLISKSINKSIDVSDLNAQIAQNLPDRLVEKTARLRLCSKCAHERATDHDRPADNRRGYRRSRSRRDLLCSATCSQTTPHSMKRAEKWMDNFSSSIKVEHFSNRCWTKIRNLQVHTVAFSKSLEVWLWIVTAKKTFSLSPDTRPCIVITITLSRDWLWVGCGTRFERERPGEGGRSGNERIKWTRSDDIKRRSRAGFAVWQTSNVLIWNESRSFRVCCFSCCSDPWIGFQAMINHSQPNGTVAPARLPFNYPNGVCCEFPKNGLWKVKMLPSFLPR